MALKKIDHNKELFCLIIITFITFFTAIYSDYSFVDDPVYILKNPLVTGLKIKDIFTQSYFSAYIPLTLLSYCADFFIYGNNPAGFHATNIIIHIINCILLFLLLIRLTKNNREVAFLTTLIFAIHPLQVQSVVWISERKGVLSPLFMLISLKYYIDFKEEKKNLHYFLCFLFLTFSLLAKPSAVTLFLLFIAYDIFIQREKIRSTLINKLPFVAVSLIFTYITIVAQDKMGAVRMYHGGSFYTNLITIPKAVVHYLTTTLFPKDLLFYYDIEPVRSIFSPYSLLGIFIIALLIYIMVKNRGTSRMIPFGISIFFIFMLPVSNIVPIETIASDRYMYFPIIGLALAVFTALDPRTARHKATYHFVMIAAACMLSVVTINDIAAWRTKEGIWEEILEKKPGNLTAISNLSELYLAKGRRRDAFVILTRGLKIDKDDPRLLKNMALLDKVSGRTDDALKNLERALKIDPNDKEIYFELAKIYFDREDYDEAEKQLEAGRRTKYDYPLDIELSFDYIQANIHVKRIEFDKAIGLFEKIISRSENFLDAKKRHTSLASYYEEFNKNRDLFIKSGGGEEYKEILRSIFNELNLVREGELYIATITAYNK